MMKQERKYSISELAALTGVTRRTIRFYVQKGLLQSPLGRGRGKHYTEAHLERILKIRELQKEGIPLDRMRQAIEGEPLPAIEELERRLVTRVRIGDGIWLEFSQDAKIPTPGKLTQLAEFCRKILALPRSENDGEGLTNQSKGGTDNE